MGLALPVRMTVVRLANGAMWLHSPTRCDDALAREITRIGPVRHLVAPNVAHWSFLKDWAARCPDATTWAAPGLRDRAPVKASGTRLDHDLGTTPPAAWASDIDQGIVPGGFGVSEVAFLHRASGTLVLTDLIENFEPEKVGPLARPLLALMGAMAPDGKAPAHLRFAINRRRAAARAVARELVAWQPERVIFAHGRWFEQDGSAALRRSLRWLLD
ncbi:hypothetical protein CH341_22660 [Rhodoplanes roseus]|uniref:DUF4336 domain-containing protein n=2 Tax=Rhodoplanes roseus TaxID=29409 RepID=A0A327KSR6_9BRAD|nr:hypothetical protein CH341_22660 [Rhodoplanes roseus]